MYENNTDYTCRLCNSQISNCSTCTNFSYCTSCVNNTYLAITNNFCVANCSIHSSYGNLDI